MAWGWRLGACALAGMLAAGCGKGSSAAAPKPLPSLPLLATHVLTIQEPSDLAIDETGTRLWTVTNNPEKVYQLDVEGTVVKTLSYVGSDLEGIAYDARDQSLWVAEENLRQVVHLDTTGAVLSKHALALTGEQNSGLEGICLNDSGSVFVLNEKHPGMFIRLAQDVTISSMVGLSFAQDYSGMTYDPQGRVFWIVSDQSQALYLWSTSNTVLAQYSLAFPKPEGVARDPARGRVYVVSDATNTLYVFQEPAATGSHAP